MLSLKRMLSSVGRSRRSGDYSSEGSTRYGRGYRKSSQETIEESIAAAAEQHLENQPKVDIATDAMFLGHMNRIAHQEEEDVRRYKGKTVFGKDPGEAKEGQMPGDVIIAENYDRDRNVQSRTNWGIPLATVLLGLGAICLGAYAIDNSKEDDPPIAVTPRDDTDTKYKVTTLPGE